MLQRLSQKLWKRKGKRNIIAFTIEKSGKEKAMDKWQILSGEDKSPKILWSYILEVANSNKFFIIILSKIPKMSNFHCTKAIKKFAFKFLDNCSTWIRDVLATGGSL